MKNLRSKLDCITWWIIYLLPVIGALICFAFGGDNTFAEFSSFIDEFAFGFITDIFHDVEDLVHFTFPSLLVSYASYMVSVEIFHVFVDAFVFLPRFAHNFVDCETYISPKGGKSF